MRPQMPRRSWKTAEALQYTQAAAATLRDIAGSTYVPFLSTIAALSLTIIPLVQGARINKNRCMRIVEQIHELLCSLGIFLLDSDHPPTPKMLDQIGAFAQTLQKFYACLRSQQEIGLMKRFFKQVEITVQLDACEAELGAAVEVFKIRSGVGVSVDIAQMDIDGDQRHQELLDLFGNRQNRELSDTASSTRGTFLDMNSSSGTLPLLPASPQIFHGRDQELKDAVIGLLSEPARVAILGMGGIGKTALATAALYDPRVMEKYPHRHFVSCESASNAAALVILIGSHLGIEPSASLTKAITRYFSESGPSILVLDNFETPWESPETRPDVEEFLSLLAGIPHLALLLTMRGAERPAKVKWTRPFLIPLEPLSLSAARQTFVTIADDPGHEDEEALTKLLDLTGHLPLAVTLMASIASFEGYSGALSRWEVESTSLLSDGLGRTSNLDLSIRVSLGSPRITSSPHAMELLSLLSILPDGISEDDLLASEVPIPDIPTCRASLIRTSLVYKDRDGRLKSLNPIRGYMQRFHGPPYSLTDPLRRYFEDLLSVWSSHQQISSGLVPRLTSHLGNIRALVLAGLDQEESGHSEIGDNILTFNHFCYTMLKGTSSLMQRVPNIVESTDDRRLHWKYIEARLSGLGPSLSAPDAENLIREGIQYFVSENDLAGQINYQNTAVTYYIKQDMTKAREHNILAFELAKDSDNVQQQLKACRGRATIGILTGNYCESLGYAMEVVQLARTLGSVQDECNGLMDEALNRCHLGELRQAQDICTQARQLMRACGLDGSNREIAILDMEAEVHFQKSEYAQARVLNGLVASMTSVDVMPHYHANALISEANLCILTAVDELQIRGTLDAAKQLTDTLEWTTQKIMCEQTLAALSLRRGETTAARAVFKRCFSTSGAQDTTNTFISLQHLGDPTYKMCDDKDTFHWAGTYFALARKSNELGHTYQALRCLGDIFLAQGDEASALSIFRAVLAGSKEMDVHLRRADSMVRIGDILGRRGEVTKAKEMWEEARLLFIRSSQDNEAAGLDERLARISPTTAG
ncbi:hypothetical protein C8R44DRAFT_790175 [Mycena epipterygia]|nr:hypothetical protein C8R44DRAFT_790175 [Mycena epipterygia]